MQRTSLRILEPSLSQEIRTLSGITKSVCMFYSQDRPYLGDYPDGCMYFASEWRLEFRAGVILREIYR